MKRNVIISIFFLIHFVLPAQTKVKQSTVSKEAQLFYLDKALNDTIKREDVNVSSILCINPNLKVVRFEISSKINSKFLIFPCSGNKLSNTVYYSGNSKTIEPLYIEKIVATDGKIQKHYKGFKVYVR